MKNLLLIDGSALLYRSHFAFINNPLTTKQGFITSAIFGTANTFLALIEKLNPDFIIISFDVKEKTFRHKLSDIYKANRPKMPDELIQQIKPVNKFFKLCNIPIICKAGFEADDVIATLAYKFCDEYKVTMVTGDKDYIQLLKPNVLMYNPFKKMYIDEEHVKAEYDIKVSQFIDFLALMGDSADNIPGVKGVGKKTAAKLLNLYGNLDEIYNNVSQIKGAVGKKLANDKENAFLSKKLATIVTNVELEEINLNQFKKSNLANASTFLQEYELNSLAKKVLKYNQTNAFEEDLTLNQNKEKELPKNENISNKENTNQKFEFNAICINSMQKFDELILQIKKHDVIAIDTETTGLQPITAQLVGISICFDNTNAYYIPVGHQMEENLNINIVIKKLQIAIKNKQVCGHNIKYDYRILKKYGFNFDCSLIDTMIASYLLDSANMQHSLANCAIKEFDYTMMPISDLIGKGKKQITFDLTALHDATKYAAEDAYVTFRLCSIYKQKLKNLNLEELFYKLEMPLMKVLAKIEDNGVFLDTAFLQNLSHEISQELALLTNKIFEQANKQFNINSTQQLADILFNSLQLKPIKKTKTGFSTDSNVLEALKNEHPIIPNILQYRFLNKLNSTYISALPKLVLQKTNRVHSSFNQSVASTGRLSSSNPNLQNIPIRSKLGKQIRKAFIAESSDWCILAADYSQIELRLLAAFSKNPVLLQAFNNNKDIHKQTASVIFDVDVNDVTKEQRAKAKTINFGIIYGMGATKLSKELNITRKQASEFIQNYFDRFPAIKEFMQKMVKDAKTNGFCKTITGRKLFLNNINSSNKRLQSEAERVAVNMPIQGSAADIIKKAMLLLDEFIKNRDDIKMLIQVHDELVFEVKKDSVSLLLSKVCELMEQALPDEFKGIVKLKVDAKASSNWLEAH